MGAPVVASAAGAPARAERGCRGGAAAADGGGAAAAAAAAAHPRNPPAGEALAQLAQLLAAAAVVVAVEVERERLAVLVAKPRSGVGSCSAVDTIPAAASAASAS